MMKGYGRSGVYLKQGLVQQRLNQAGLSLIDKCRYVQLLRFFVRDSHSGVLNVSELVDATILLRN